MANSKNFKLTEISKIISRRIANYNLSKLKTNEGRVVSVSDGIAIVHGLPHARYLETVNFQSGGTGLVITLEENSLGIAIINKPEKVKENEVVKLSGEIISIPISDNFLGRVIDPLGNPIDGGPKIKTTKKQQIETEAPGVIDRESVSRPLATGILAIDALIPIGRGQRELIIGDRQTGKTAIAIDTIINQRDQNVICIYVAIGQKNTSILEVINQLKTHYAFDYTVIVAATAANTETMKYIAPYAGMSIAESYMHQGKDVLIVFDDLTKHAIAYRALSLLLQRTPGREAYPGDIFYLHSRLLERAAKLSSALGGGSITALPIIETQLEDIAAYIPTNVISITDGQIFLLNELFNIGVKPAINLELSVSRVGSAAQIPAMKQTIGSLKLELSQYRELQIFSQFGGNLDPSTVKILDRGQKIVELLKQKESTALPQWIQSIFLLAIKKNILLDVATNQIQNWKIAVIKHFEQKMNHSWIKEMIKKEKISDHQQTRLIVELVQITKKFNTLHQPQK